MKTAISLPDATFERASQRAQELGVSRSEFFATAATRYLDDLDRRSLTTRIDQDLLGADPDSAAAVHVGHARLAVEDR
jgi:metal-responsive CopG/Arc/MetJ family transcriptional regulator